MNSRRAILTDEWEILPTSIKLDERIDEGSFGAIFSAIVGFKSIDKSKYANLQERSAASGDKNCKVVVKLLKGKVPPSSIFFNSIIDKFDIHNLVDL